MNKKSAFIGSIIAVAIAAVLFGTYQMGKSSPPSVVRITERPAGIAFDVRRADALEIRFSFYDYSFDGTLDRVSVLDKDGKRVDFTPQEASTADWARWVSYYRAVRQYANLQLE
ncbi:hypothetical protein A3H65_02750 [Candidatus Giovannonibacteria bacterium RIFCSPLOWO2_02_FULL_45_14]|uniref:Uncharacterized protein n=3 Tax=Parcubacteria group TaxID=1794811 RepID=A0A0H4TF60_9BACT|nr:hypothetical protein [uncultured Parcubacteria bacterium Rifle_16ft_4_minimus_37658]AKQ05670.1 hypothetical protein [uncultured Parcubacteria bacterium Rifle_16ft_4_minimus_23641]OGF69936.1 MAG: hypothetical protein A3C75_01165 [Candidatus Giovannonibacteria bacterium RIFCSPHIGHO2_02_FULL_44_31]OGF76975.1 MAG: hypothetical protein A3E62_01405 [Candidatus Giovannonibacteria bacterium RIFCSPHIGHO2_12_FULL_44_29]OGF90476.1 MAG: hypothetical protein A3H65_02750 [Candidatus Giovannonibacteria bac